MTAASGSRNGGARGSRSGDASGSHDKDGGDGGRDDDDPKLRAMRAVWLSMRQEDPPGGGLAELLAAARAKAATMQPHPTLWQRLVAALRRPQMLALATVMVLLGGAVIVGRHAGRAELRVEVAGPTGRASGHGQQATPVTSGSQGGVAAVGKQEAGGERRAGAVVEGAVEVTSDQNGAATGAVGEIPAAAGASSPARDPESADMGTTRRERAAAGASSPARDPEKADSTRRAGASAEASLKVGSAGGPVASGHGSPSADKERASAPPSAQPRQQATARGAADTDAAKLQSRGGAPGPPGGGRALDSDASRPPRGEPPSEPARPGARGLGDDEAALAASHDEAAPARAADDKKRDGRTDATATANAVPSTAPRHGSQGALARLYKQCESAARRGDCGAVKRIAGQITRTDRGYRARLAKDSPIAKCLAD